ncbi:ABC transporter ATP-binding protein [Enemella sp. A6]|uniref:ABC transporter ATP-binding protein n=1 Tax=Enemella sp. A6 TaxID=3440152 RepID=UPI003EBCB4CD
MRNGTSSTSGRPQPPAVVVERLTKRYGPRPAVDGLDLTVPTGGIHALLGPHGSGKTTVLRILVGLTRPDRGSITLLDHSIPRQLPRVMHRVGAVVGRPGFHPHVSVRHNLQVLALGLGIKSERIDECLDLLGLTVLQHETFRTLDPDSRHQVALCAALLKSPELLIMDEPADGVDTHRIAEVRAVLTHLAANGTTVLVSSHQIDEVQGWADTASIIDHGRLVIQGTVAEIVQERSHRVTIGVRDAARAERILAEHDFRIRSRGQSELVISVPGADPAETARITALLAREGLYIHQLTTHSPSLEDTIVKLSRTGAA